MSNPHSTPPEIFRFSLFEPYQEEISAGITGSRNHFNLALHTGEEKSKALENRKILCETSGVPFECLTVCEQIHGNKTAWIAERERGRGHRDHNEALKGYDALVTEEKQTLLAVFLADCIPIILFDRKRYTIAACHAGWRGTAGAIVYKTVELMKNRGSDPRDILAGIGPGIGPCCFTVGDDVMQKLESFSYRESCRGMDNTFNLKKANRLQLEKAGLKSENIETMDQCTCCGEDLFFSYRKSGGAGGRFSAFIALK